MSHPRLGGKTRAGHGDDWGSQGNPLGERVDGLLELWVFLDQELKLGDRVDDRRMVFTAEGAPDIAERRVSQLAREVHGDLARERNRLGAVLGAHVRELDPEELSDLPLDVLHGDDALFLAPEIK